MCFVLPACVAMSLAGGDSTGDCLALRGEDTPSSKQLVSTAPAVHQRLLNKHWGMVIVHKRLLYSPMPLSLLSVNRYSL